MDVMIVATKECSHRRGLSKELDEIGVEHRVVYAEDEPEICRQLVIRSSPNLVVNGAVVFRRQPTEQELRSFFMN